MIKALSKLLSFSIAFVNIVFFYLWAGAFYIVTALSTLLSRVPILSIVIFPLSLIGALFSKGILWLWLIFDYIILIVRELLMPLILKLYLSLKELIIWVVKILKKIITFFKIECRPYKKYCLKFDKTISYTISALPEENLKTHNLAYEQSIRKHFQEEIKKLYKNESQNLSTYYTKACLSKKNVDINTYNEHLNIKQVHELNIVSNYLMSIDQHRLLIVRESGFNDFNKITNLLCEAKHLSYINDKVLI